MADLIRPNYEKVFYKSLSKFRDEQLENYQGPSIGFSASDYHHIPKPVARRSSTRASLQVAGHNRRRSQFSILSSDAPRTSQSYHRQPSIAETEHSYDPFRPSRHQITNAQAEYANITVLRGASGASRRGRAPSNTVSVRHPALTRVQDEEIYTISSSPPALPPLPALPSAANGQNNRLRRERMARYVSRSSLASSNAQRTSTAAFHKSASYKRGVNFSHTRKRSTSDQLPPSRVQQAPSPPTLQQRYINDKLGTSTPTLPKTVLVDSPDPLYSPVIRSRKEAPNVTLAQDIAARKAKTTSHYWKEEARIVSSELEKFCDEAFNRSSVASSAPTTVAGPYDQSYGTSATSLFVREDSGASVVITSHGRNAPEKVKDPYHERPLPQPPSSELIGSYTQRELTKTRDLLRQRAADPNAGMTPGYLDEVIAHLDRLMQPSTVKSHQQGDDRRVTSAPDQKPPNVGKLSQVREEGQNRRHVSTVSYETKQKGNRAVSEPTSRKLVASERSPTRRARIEDEPSIRMVQYNDAPMSPIRPLVIRKRSGASTPSEESIPMPQSQEQLREPQTNPTKAQSMPDNKGFRSYFNYAQGEERRSVGLSLLESSLEPIVEDDNKENIDSREWKTQSGETKKRSWFRRQHGRQRSKESDRGPTPPIKDDWPLQDARDVESKKDANMRKRTSNASSQESQKSEPKKERSSGKGKFFKIFSKRDSKESKDTGMLQLGSRFSFFEQYFLQSNIVT